ncbi:hypothetical protein PENSPDRAFT_541351, partial [Peniophora sp. CONT]
LVPTERLTLENLVNLKLNKDGNLWPEKIKLFQHIMMLCEESLAFSDDQHGTLQQDYFSNYVIPCVDHALWVDRNILIPP